MFSLVALGAAVALFVVHLLDGRVPRSYVLAAFILSAVVAAGDIREAAGQTCAASEDAVTVCVVNYTVKVEALAALITSIVFVMLVLVFEALDRLGRTVGGWDV